MADLTEKNRGGKPFVKDDPRINRDGRPPGSLSIIAEIKKQLDEIADEDPQKRKKLELMVRKMLLKAINDGDTSMIREIIDRVHGKPSQSIDMNVNKNDESWDADRVQMQEIIKQIKDGKVQNNSETVGKAILQKQQ